MEEKKKVTKKLENILNNDIVKAILSYDQKMGEIIPLVCSWWGYDLYSRKPGPAYFDEDMNFHTTDLDLACFLFELANRKAVINLPEYHSFRPRSVKEGQVLTSKENRHGQLLGLNANKETFNFSIKIKDMNVITSDAVGDYRNFSITDLSGKWYNGWKNIEFIPNTQENKFIEEFLLSVGNTISFENFVHPNRWTSFFGQYYIITKLLIDRLTEEASYYKKEVDEMLKEGIKYPTDGQNYQEDWPNQEKEKGKSIQIEAFEVKIESPKIENNQFPKYEHNQENLVLLARLRKSYVYHIIQKLRFGVRATELSYYLRVFNNGDVNEVYPAWIENKWIKDYVQSGKRTKWDKLVIATHGSSDVSSISILRRCYKKSEIVSENYAG